MEESTVRTFRTVMKSNLIRVMYPTKAHGHNFDPILLINLLRNMTINVMPMPFGLH